MEKLLFIVNPKAGKRKSTAPLFDAVARFSQAGYLVRLFVTTAGGDAYQVAAETAQDYDLVVCAGGDGTLNEVISGLMTREKRPPLGYLPKAAPTISPPLSISPPTPPWPPPPLLRGDPVIWT